MNKIKKFFSSKNYKQIIVVFMLFIIALIFVVYVNYLANIIKKQEETQIYNWAREIQKKAKLVSMSNSLFDVLSEEERIKVALYSKTSKLILNETNEQKLSLFLDILLLNDNIPTVQTDLDYRVIEYRNINDSSIEKNQILDSIKNRDFFRFKPIEIDYQNTKSYIFYKESNIYEKLILYTKLSQQSFYDDISMNTSQLPIIILDNNNNIIKYANLPSSIKSNDTISLREYVNDLKSKDNLIELDFLEGEKNYIYYQNSSTINNIRYLPILIFGIIGALIYISFIAIRNTNRNETNQLWVGMSKETAHQLGTPISSLSAWVEILKDKLKKTNNKDIVHQIEKDINRLSLIADRFAKIGSKPILKSMNIYELLFNSMEYLKGRASHNIEFNLISENRDIVAKINKQLFEWVIENLIRNSIDAMSNEGKIEIKLFEVNQKVIIELIDNGKGIDQDRFEDVFNPGYTTKKRGWGLGLSLCKRIVEEYFEGKIYIKKSEPNTETVFRIELA